MNLVKKFIILCFCDSNVCVFFCILTRIHFNRRILRILNFRIKNEITFKVLHLTLCNLYSLFLVIQMIFLFVLMSMVFGESDISSKQDSISESAQYSLQLAYVLPAVITNNELAYDSMGL